MALLEKGLRGLLTPSSPAWYNLSREDCSLKTKQERCRGKFYGRTAASGSRPQVEGKGFNSPPSASKKGHPLVRPSSAEGDARMRSRDLQRESETGGNLWVYPNGRGNWLKPSTVWVRIPPPAPTNTAGEACLHNPPKHLPSYQGLGLLVWLWHTRVLRWHVFVDER